MTTSYYPYFKKDALLFSRQEKQGCTLFQSKKRDDLSFQIANRTANEVVALCDGKRSIQDITAQMAKKYPVIDTDRILNDTYNVLRHYDIHGLIDWMNDESPFKIECDQFTIRFDNHTLVRRADERDYETVLSLIRLIIDRQDNKNEEILYASPAFKASGIISRTPMLPGQLELIIRQSFFSFSQFFYILEKKEKSIGLLSLLRPLPGHFSTSVGFFVLVDNNNTTEKAIDYYLQAISQDVLLHTIPIHQIRLVISENENDHTLIDVVEQQGFKRAAVLPDEYGENIAELIYTYKIHPMKFSAFKPI